MKKASSLLNLLVALSMVFALFATGASSAGAQTEPPRPPKELKANFDEPIAKFMKTSEPTNALERIDPALRELAQKGGDQKIEVYVSVTPGVDLSKFLTQMIVRPEILKGQRNVYGITTADRLMGIAQQTGVIAVVDSSNTLREKPFDPEQADKKPVDQAAAAARLQYLRQNEKTYQETVSASDIGVAGWFDVLDGHKSSASWAKSFKGDGVIVGVLDDGVDFGHPDLQGTTAWVTDEESPYYGWPMAFSQVSLKYFAQEVRFQDLGAKGITEGWGGTRWSDTMTTRFHETCWDCTTGYVDYQPLSEPTHSYKIPLTSRSFNYKLGTFNELNLEAAWGHRVAVLVTDEHEAGVYDTVYVDLDNDFDFTDEKPVTQDSPEVYRDMDGDGYADLSGGQLVWISDGENTPPGADWLWGVQCGDEVGTLKACPDSGSLLLFAGAFDAGYTHGTQCASNVAGQGVVNDGLSAPSFRKGGMVQGAAPHVGVMDFGNHYYAGTDEDEFIMAAVGYDGIPYSGDEVQITSNSYGSFTQMWGGWGYIGRLITTINLTVGENTVWVFSGGNEGPGWGPQEGEAGPTILKVGSSTQYGSTNWDSIAGKNQIVYGDPSSFSSHGPNRDGSSGLDVLANGGRGAGDEGINYYGFNGATSWATWGGTSRSAPVAAGNLALGFQAYKERYGRWPAWYEVLPTVKSSATNSVSDPFLQGGGVINADRMTNIAAGVYGVVATPDEWQVGDWQGNNYYNFANVAWPSATYTKTYTVYNPSGYDITVDLSSGSMQRFAEYDYDFTTSEYEAESAFNFHSPDYLIDLNTVMNGDAIPADAELMVVRFTQPYDQFDPQYQFSGTPANSWRFLMYDWTDINKDGNLWIDKNHNGAVNHVDNEALGTDNDGFYQVDYAADETEIQQGEYVRMDYEFGGNGIPIFTRNPSARMNNGYFLGLQHRINDGTVEQTDFKIRVEFYKRAPWSWLSLDTGSLDVPAYSNATFEAQVHVSDDAVPGAYEGVIWMYDHGNQWYDSHETALPVVVNVITDLDTNEEGSTHMGGGERTNALYQNGWTNGYFNWYGGGWTGAGDWRHYFFNVGEEYFDDEYQWYTDTYMAEKPNLLVHTSWSNYALAASQTNGGGPFYGYPTDINTWVLGPTEDCASNGVSPCAWYAEDLGQPSPETFGPYTLQPIGSSSPFLAGAAYPFHTSTGGPDDWLLVPLEQPGLHEIALHNVLYSGKSIEESFHVDVGTLNLEATIDEEEGRIFRGTTEARVFQDSGSLDLWFTPSLAIPDLDVTLAGGLATAQTGPMTVTVRNDNGGAGKGPNPVWDERNTEVPFMVTTPGTTELRVHVYMEAASDADVFLYYDVNDNGIREKGIDQRVGSGTKGKGEDEDIVLSNPQLGRYFMVFNGYDMSDPDGVVLDWAYWITAPGPIPFEEHEIYSSDYLTVTQDDPIDPRHSYSFAYDFWSSERTSAIRAELTSITDTADVDLYLVDVDTDTILAKSQEYANGDEVLEYLPGEGEYRLGVGPKLYRLIVHGFSVPYGPIYPHLQLWTEELNLWLDYPAAHPDVHVNEIMANETVSVTLMYAKTDFAVGDLLSARVIAGPSVLPGALSELVSIKRVDYEDLPDISATQTFTVKSDRSDTYTMDIGGAYADLVVAAPGDIVNFTFTVKNTGTEEGILNPYISWRTTRWDFVDWVTEPPVWYHGTNPGCTDGCEYLDSHVPLAPGESATYEYRAQRLGGGTVTGAAYVQTMETDIFWFGDYWTVSDYAYAGSIYLYFTDTESFGDSMLYDDMTERSVKAAPEYIAPDESFTYYIHLHNPSSYEAGLYVEDFLPEGVVFDDWSQEDCSTEHMGFDSQDNKFWWSGWLPVEGCTLELYVHTDAEVHEGQELVNEASLSDKYQGEPFGWLKATTVVDELVRLGVTKTVDKLIGAKGYVLNYEITLTNYGERDANQASAVDTLHEYTTLVAGSLQATRGSVEYDENTRTIYWQGDLGSGESVVITFETTIDQDAPYGKVLLNAVMATAENWNWYSYASAVTQHRALFMYLPVILLHPNHVP